MVPPIFSRHSSHFYHVVPGYQDRFDVFRQVAIVIPPDGRVSEFPKRLRIRATAEVPPSGRKSGSPARFDMALVTHDGVRASRMCTLECKSLIFTHNSQGNNLNSSCTSCTDPCNFYSASPVRCILTAPGLCGVVHTVEGAKPVL
jgi:hypothetical protein